MKRLVVDPDALDEARRDLGLSYACRVAFKRLPDSLDHAYYDGVCPYQDRHLIRINKYLTADAANAALWHELTHAVQCEQAGSWAAFYREYLAQIRETGAQRGSPNYGTVYRTAPYEAEAWKATAAALTGHLPALVLRSWR